MFLAGNSCKNMANLLKKPGNDLCLRVPGVQVVAVLVSLPPVSLLLSSMIRSMLRIWLLCVLPIPPIAIGRNTCANRQVC